jgi:hypothetical protein
MTRLLYALCCVVVLCSSLFVSAQWCGTPPLQGDALQRLRGYQQTIQRGEATSRTNTVRYIPIKVWLVANTDGSEQYPVPEAFMRVCELNQQYAQTNMQFYLADNNFRVIKNTTWNTTSPAQSSIMPGFNRAIDTFNMYIVKNAVNGGNVPLCGYYSPGPNGAEAVFITKESGCFGGSSTTLMHEAGHYFSLPHTFSGWEGTSYQCGTTAPLSVNSVQVEKADGSNCTTSGDGFCDTPADYLSERWNCDQYGQSTCTLVDPTGTSFHADGQNSMSYSQDVCVTKFTPNQIAAMHLDLDQRELSTETKRKLTHDFTPPTPTGDFALFNPGENEVVPYDIVTFDWADATNATGYYLEISKSSAFFPFSLVYSGLYNTSNAVLTNVLQPNSTYYLRVRAYNKRDLCAPFKIRTFQTSSDIVGVQNITAVQQLTLAPNPVSIHTPLTVLYTATDNKNATIRLYDYTGRTLYTLSATLHKGSNTIQIPTDHLTAGVYMLQIAAADGGSIQRKFVVTQ